MSQEQASQRTTSHLSHAAMVPNMLPMAHAGTPMPGAGATGGQFFLPPMAPSQDPFPAARPHHTYVPDLAYPSLYSYPPMQPRGVRRPPPNGLVMPPKFKVDNNMNISFQGLRRDSQEHENTGNPQTIPAYRESLKRSRLPSDGAARKTPVKATSSTSSRPDISSPNTSWKQPRKLAKSIKSGILRTTASKQPRRQNSPLKQLETPVPSPPKRRRAIMDEDDETDETDETDEANFPQPSVVSPAPSEMISKPDSRPRPRYDYTVPEELESTRTALGKRFAGSDSCLSCMLTLFAF
jgi:hypothetical protein